jgi:hypothetical protein
MERTGVDECLPLFPVVSRDDAFVGKRSAWLQLGTFQRVPLRLGEIRPKTRHMPRGPNRTICQRPPSGTVSMEDVQEVKRQSIDSTLHRLKKRP